MTRMDDIRFLCTVLPDSEVAAACVLAVLDAAVVLLVASTGTVVGIVGLGVVVGGMLQFARGP